MATRSLLRRSPRSSPVLLPRKYHSHTHPPPPGPFTAVEQSILAAAISHIPTHGFTSTSLALGAKDAGYIDASVNLFPRGAFELVRFHLVAQRGALVGKRDELAVATGEKKLGVGAMVKALTWERLMGNQDIIHRWQEALALMAQPSNIPASINELSLLSDEIWYLAGDVSVDSSWYTKRASLSTIYASTELFMTSDKSSGYEETKDFLDRRFADGQAVGSVVGSVAQWVGFTAGAGVNVLRSKGLRI